MTTSLTISALIEAADSANTLDKAKNWIQTVRAYALNDTDDKMPNRMPVARECTLALDSIKSDTYTSAITDIKMALQGVQDLINGTVLPTNNP